MRDLSRFIMCSIIISLSCTGAPNLENRLAIEVPGLIESAGVPGLSLAVIRKGKIIYSNAFGVRNRETGDAVDTGTIFEAASLTKTVTAACALKLMEQGLLDLDAPLAVILPYPKLSKDERYKKITARMVLTHTTGLPNWGNRLIRKPGKLYGYSGEGFLYLGHAITEITGKSLDDFAREEIFQPLGMNRTRYIWTEEYAANGANGHDRNGFMNPLRRIAAPNGGASLLTTADDYARFLCAILNDELLQPETIALMLTPHIKATVRGKTTLDEHISWGFGWGIQPGKNGNGFWHWGNNGDLRGYTAAYKKDKSGLVFFANSENTFNLAEQLVSLITDERQYAMEWLSFKQDETPREKLVREVEKAFIVAGAGAGKQKLLESLEMSPELITFPILNRMARYMSIRRQDSCAEVIFRQMTAMDPNHVEAWEGLALALMEQKLFSESLDAFSQLKILAPERALSLTAESWVKDLMAAEKTEVESRAGILSGFAGRYGSITIELRGNRLFYQKTSGPQYPLQPLGRGIFTLEGNLKQRLRFTLDKDGSVSGIISITMRGIETETPRTAID